MFVRPALLVTVAVALAGIASPARAEFGTQTLNLRPGWNAVFIEVQPADHRCVAVFAGLPVKTVWHWNRSAPMKQFISNPDELLPKPPDWLLYYPKGEARAFLSDLFTIEAGEAYLIELGGDQPVSLALAGAVTTERPAWVADSFNLAGFYVNPAKQVTFSEYFKHEPALSGQAVYRVSESGDSVAVDLAKDTLAAGEAYWVYCKGASRYGGPVAVEAPKNTGIDFGTDATESELVFRNETPDEQTLTLRLVDSARSKGAKSDSQGGLPVAGGVELSYKGLLAWQPVPAALTFTLRPKSTERIQLGVRRSDLQPAPGKAAYESVIEVDDPNGGRFRVPVKAVADASRAGLWVGNASLTRVSEVGRPNDLTTTNAPSPFEFRLIVHVDEDGDATLLQKVYLMQVQAVFGNQDPPVELEPARYVLLTRDDLVPQFTGVSLRAGDVVGRRITSPVFSFPEPVDLVGGVEAGQTLTASVRVDYDDPLNPFVHLYHPDHDNLNERFETGSPLGEGKESFTFERSIRLEFTAQDPEALGLPAWGYSLIGGNYREDVTGVHKRTIRTEGTFRLTRVSSVAILNDGQN